MIENVKIKDNSVVYRKFVLYIDVSISDDGKISLGQKLTSFFGQAGIFEGTEKINEYVENYFKNFCLSQYLFKDEMYLENDFYFEDSVYIPLVFYYYFGDKKVDFYFKCAWLRDSSYDVFQDLFIFYYDYLKKFDRLYAKKLNYYNKIKNKTKMLNVLNFCRDKKGLFSIFYKLNLDFFEEELKYIKYFDDFFDYLTKKKNRLNYTKKIKIKNKKVLLKMLKKFKDIDLNFVYNFVILKVLFLDIYYNEIFFYNKIIDFLSQLYQYKNNFLFKLRRKKKYIKKIIKNFNGKKFTFFKKQIIEKPKKLKKRRR